MILKGSKAEGFTAVFSIIDGHEGNLSGVAPRGKLEFNFPSGLHKSDCFEALKSMNMNILIDSPKGLNIHVTML